MITELFILIGAFVVVSAMLTYAYIKQDKTTAVFGFIILVLALFLVGIFISLTDEATKIESFCHENGFEISYSPTAHCEKIDGNVFVSRYVIVKDGIVYWSDKK